MNQQNNDATHGALGQQPKNHLFTATEPISVEQEKRRNQRELEWASAFIPVLAIEEGVDHATAAVGTKVLKRADLAARFGVDPEHPIGQQLAERGEMSYNEARLIDGRLFEHPVSLRLRIPDSVENLSSLVPDLLSECLIDAAWNQLQQHGYTFISVRTRKFVELVKAISERTQDSTVLLSINGTFLYM